MRRSAIRPLWRSLYLRWSRRAAALPEVRGWFRCRTPPGWTTAVIFTVHWAGLFTPARGKRAILYERPREVFSACAGAAIYERRIFDEIGGFDEAHFAYLEDVDVCWRARIAGYRSIYVPNAVVRHVGSATSGSIYNEFKVRHSSRNSIYLIYKNMPFLQIVLNLPFLIVGFLVKFLFFVKNGGPGGTYAKGLISGVRMCRREKKVRFQWKNLRNYGKIQLELWVNLIRRVKDF